MDEELLKHPNPQKYPGAQGGGAQGMVPGHDAASFNFWIKPKVSSQQTPTPKHVPGFAKHSSAALRFALRFDCSALYGALWATLH